LASTDPQATTGEVALKWADNFTHQPLLSKQTTVEQSCRKANPPSAKEEIFIEEEINMADCGARLQCKDTGQG